MAYNEWDDPTTPIPNLDEMKYELAAKNPISLVKKAIEHMPGSAFVQGVAPVVTFPFQVAGSALYGLGKQIFEPSAADFNKDTTQAMRALQYEPPSQAGRNYQEAIMSALETAKVPPYIGHMPPMRISPSDVQVMGARGISAAREIGDIPRDFQAAQSGLMRQNVYGEPTYGAKLQGVAEDIGDVMARRQAQGKSAIPGVEVFSDLVPETNLYAVRPNKSGSSIIREVPTPLNPAYSITGESRLSEDLSDIVDRQGPRTEDGKSYQHLTQFTNYVPGEFNKSAQQMFHDFVQPILAKEFPKTDPEDYSRAVHAKYGNNANEWYKKQLEAFALLPEAKLHNEKAFQVAMSDPDIPNPFEFLRDVLIIPPSAEFKGKKAADEWVMNNLQNYLVEHLGTPGDPIPRLIAETGRVSIEDARDRLLTHNQRLDDQVRDLRRRAGMPTEGTYEPEIGRARDLLSQNNLTLQLLQDRENALIAANPGVRPQQIPGWKEARKEVVQATKRKDETAKRLENLTMAQAYENYSDVELTIADEKRFMENLEPYFKERFPMLPTNRDIAFQMRVPSPYRELAKDVQNRLAISGAPGVQNVVKPEDIASYSVPKAVQIKAELMHQREKMSEQAAKVANQKLMAHTKARMEAMPQDGTYGVGTAVRISKDLSPEQIKSDLSDITTWMDHCIGRGGSPEKKMLSPKAKALGAENVPEKQRYRRYIPTVESHLGNRVPQGSSGSLNQYMNEVRKGEADIVDFRDTETGVPFATLKLVASKTEPGMYQFSEFYGYQDKDVTGPWHLGRNTDYTADENNAYRQVIADWANAHQSQLKPAGSEYLISYANIYDGSSAGHQDQLMTSFHLKKAELNEVMHQIGKRFVTRPEFQAAVDAFKAEPQESIESLRAARDELESQLREAEDPEATMGIQQMDDIRHQITVLDQYIAEMENRPPAGAREIQPAVTFRQILNEFNGDLNDAQVAQRIDQLIANPAVTRQELRDLLSMMETDHPQFRWTDADLYDDLHRRVYEAAENRPQAAQLPAEPRNTPRDIAETVSAPAHQSLTQRIAQVEALTNAINEEIRSIPTAPAELRQAELFYSDPNNLPASIVDHTHQFEDAERIASYLLQHVHSRLVNQPRNETAQLPAVGNAYTTVQRALRSVIQSGDINAMTQLSDNMMTNRNGVYAELNDAQRTELRQQLNDAIDQARADRNRPVTQGELQAVQNSLRDPLPTSLRSAPRVFDAYQQVIRDIGENDSPDDALQHLTIVRDILNDPDTDLQAEFNLQQPGDRQALDALIVRHGDAIQALTREEEGGPLVLDDDQLDNIASDYLNNLENPTSAMIRQEADDMRNGMIDLPEFREITPTQRTDAQNEIAYRMEQHADMMDDMEPPEDPNLALPVPQQDVTVEQAAMNEALQFPRYWQQRHPSLPNNVITGIMHQLDLTHNFASVRDDALAGGQGTIFTGLTNPQRITAVRMIDEIGNRYQNELNIRDTQNQPQGQYTNTIDAYRGILRSNNNFLDEDGLNTLQALPQLLRRENLRQHFGIENLSQRERDDLIRHFQVLAEDRARRLPPPEGHKKGGYIRKKMNEGGKISPTVPSQSVNDQSKPVEPIKRIHNPDAPEFKDLFIRERAIRGGTTQSGGPSADIKQIMNPRNINYASGGGVRGYSPMDEALNQPGLKHKFTEQDILRNYGDSVFESYDRARTRKRLEPIVLKNATQPSNVYDDGQSLMNRMSVPLGTAQPRPQPSGQSFEDLQRQHMDQLRADEVVGHRDIDAMRYELLRKQ